MNKPSVPCIALRFHGSFHPLLLVGLMGVGLWMPLGSQAQNVIIFDGRAGELRRLIEDIRSEIAALRITLLEVEDRIIQSRRKQLQQRQQLTDARTALTQAQRQTQGAFSELSLVRMQMDKPRREIAELRDQLLQQARLTPEYQNTKAQLDAAQQERDKAHAAVLAELETQTSYREAQGAFLEARTQLGDLKRQGNVSPMQLAESHATLLRHESSLNHITQKALGEHAGYVTAQASLEKAQAHMQQVEAKLLGDIDTHQRMIALNQHMRSQQEKIDQAQAVHEALLQRQRDAERQSQLDQRELQLTLVELDGLQKQKQRIENDIRDRESSLRSREAELSHRLRNPQVHEPSP